MTEDRKITMQVYEDITFFKIYEHGRLTKIYFRRIPEERLSKKTIQEVKDARKRINKGESISEKDAFNKLFGVEK